MARSRTDCSRWFSASSPKDGRSCTTTLRLRNKPASIFQFPSPLRSYLHAGAFGEFAVHQLHDAVADHAFQFLLGEVGLQLEAGVRGREHALSLPKGRPRHTS